MSARVLITGAGSCSGRHLANHLLAAGKCEISASDLAAPAGWPGEIPFAPCDVTERRRVGELLRASRPHVVYHLAGAIDESSPAQLVAVNALGTANLLEAAAALEPRPAVLLVGSAAIYPELPEGGAGWEEADAVRPSTFYAYSREAQLELGRIAHMRWGMPVFLARPFNLVGPGLRAGLAPVDILRRVLDCVGRGVRTIEVRDAGAVRDFVDVRDAVRAYRLIVERGRPAVPYNVSSGIGRTIRELVDATAAAVGVSLEVRETPAAGRAERSPLRRSVGCNGLLRRETGWVPEIPFAQSVADLAAAVGGEAPRPLR